MTIHYNILATLVLYSFYFIITNEVYLFIVISVSSTTSSYHQDSKS